LSFGEKLTATFMSLGMILPNTVSLFKDVISTGQNIKNWYIAI